MRYLSYLVIFLITSSCSHSNAYKDATYDDMKRNLEADIPVGTSTSDAEVRLRQRGFEATRMTDASFVCNDGQVRKHLDYLYGDRYDGGVVHRRWQVALVLKEDAIVEILVSTGLVGP